MVDFDQENEKIDAWKREQKWEVSDPFTHLTSPELFVGFDEIIKKFYHFAALGKNYAVLYGQYGYGKTSIIKKLAYDYKKKYNVLLFEDAPEREYIAEKIKTLCSGKLLRKITFQKIDSYDYTSLNALVKKRTVLIFDEAHSMDEKTYSYIRSLSESGNTFSMIFAGKPELVSGKKILPHYLQDRLELSESLRPLTETEATEMIRKRVELLAKSSNYLFTEKSMVKIAKHSRFIPREILEHCSKMIEFAINKDIHEVNEADVDRYFATARDAVVPEHVPLLPMPEYGSNSAYAETVEEVEPEEKLSTYEKMMEGTVPKFKGAAYGISRNEFLKELSPLQKRIVLYLFSNEPKSAKEISAAINDAYDTIRHMLKRLQGKYGEPDTKKSIKEMFPLIDEKENPNGRGYVYSLSAQTRKVLSTD